MDVHPLPLREQLKVLVNLQELDLKIDSLKKKQLSLPHSLKAINELIHTTKTSIELKNAAIIEVEKSLRHSQAASELNQDRLKRAHEKLAVVHNSQEFQAANKEIDQLKKLNTTLEEQLKKYRLESELIKAESEALNQELLTLKEEYDLKSTLITDESREIDSQTLLLQQERLQFTPSIHKQMLSLYDRVRSARNGLGLVTALNGRCSGCHLCLPPQLIHEIMKYIHSQSCPNCHRILFVQETPKA